MIAAYTATGAEQLSLNPGQLIQVRKKSPSGWWEGELQVCIKIKKNIKMKTCSTVMQPVIISKRHLLVMSNLVSCFMLTPPPTPIFSLHLQLTKNKIFYCCVACTFSSIHIVKRMVSFLGPWPEEEDWMVPC